MNTILSSAKPIPAKTKGSLASRILRNKYVYLLLLPSIILTFIFNYMPYVGLYMAFTDFDIFKGIFGSTFVGLKHFENIIRTPAFSRAVVNTLLYSAILLFGGTPVPIILALMFNELHNKFFKRFSQTVSYLPYFISWISVVALFQTFLSFDGPFNDIRRLLLGPEADPFNPLMEPGRFYYILIIFISHLWKNAGWGTVIYLAAIAGIDAQLYEAAVIDGCKRWKQIWHITLPMIIPTTTILLVLNMGSLVNVNFEQFYGFHNLYNLRDNEVINTIIYKRGLNMGEYSLATAFGLSQGIVSFILVLLSNRLSKKLGGSTVW